ncbi:MAG: Fic family protein [Acutalibacteraceae bacterium]|nr:Fic family protein [Acutalibacteraceae bacterium]
MSIYQKIDLNKSAIDRYRPFEGEMLKQTRDYYRVGITWTSNAIEGNTLTESETKILLEDGLTVGGKPLKYTYEAIGHGKAYDYMFTLIKSDTITTENILMLHKLFYQNIDSDNAGAWRKQPIFVSGSDYVFPLPEELQVKMAELEKWIKTERDNYHPVEFAALLHLKFVTIHPFIDGNGRTARLLTNLALIQKGYLPVIVPPIYKLDYNGYIRLYQNKGNASKFVEFIAEQEVETQKEMMRLLQIKL